MIENGEKMYSIFQEKAIKHQSEFLLRILTVVLNCLQIKD